jgi:hypothetical protein
VLRIQSPVPFFRPLDPGWVKNQDPDPGQRTRIELFDRIRILDGKNSVSEYGIQKIKIGSRINIPDPQH